MNRRRLVSAAFLSLAILGLVPIESAQAQAPAAAYPTMAPLDQYLMADRNAEIALARSAAPEAISSEAKILVLGRHGYETASRARMALSVLLREGGCRPVTLRNFGIQSFVVRSASIRRRCDPYCRLL